MATELIRWDPGNQFRRLITVPNQLLKERDGGGNARAFFSIWGDIGVTQKGPFSITYSGNGENGGGRGTNQNGPFFITYSRNGDGGGLPRGGGGLPRGGGGLTHVAPRQGNSVWCVMSSPKGKTLGVVS